MRNHRTLYAKLVFYAFCVMVASNSLAGLTLMVLHMAGIGNVGIPRRLLSTAWALVLAVFIGLFLTAWLGKRYLSPITRLIEATFQVAKGDFSVRLEAGESEDEVNSLMRSFNSMTQQLGSMEIFRSDFINNFSHEFRTPIVSIRGFARQLQRDDLTEEQRREYASIIVAESERLSNLATNILRLSSLESREILTDLTTFRLDEQLRTSILLLEKDWEAKRLQLNVELEDMDWLGNADLLSQAWLNLIGNAIKFTPENGQVTVSLHRENDCAVVRVTDTGIGMDESAREHVFDKFFQADASHHFEGNGLGMALVKRIVTLSHGEITCESEIGRGTTFTVRLEPI
ncbi:MAG: HAMP domain-containing histidine kinase [Clostridia bacterium]|nr:HAMP domain-containing histidine kinase [Clostridia bacterium]